MRDSGKGIKRFRYVFTDAGTKYLPAPSRSPSRRTHGRTTRGNGGLAGVKTFYVQGPTADVVNPQGGAGIDINTLNGRNWIDVTLPAAPTGYAIDFASITDLAPEFVLGGPGVGSVAVDATQAPLVLDAGHARFATG